MINSVMNAYEEMNRQRRDSLLQTVKRSEVIDKVYFVSIFVMTILMTVFLLTNHAIALLWLLSGFFLITCLWMVVARRNIQKNWNKGAKKYNETLNMIKDILMKPEYHLYEKNKLKQLIRKYNIEIADLESKNIKIKEKYNSYFNLYIIPIVTFCAGKLCEDLKGNEMLELAFLGVFFLFVAKIVGYAIEVIRAEIIEGDELERKRYFVRKLQDLLDRDFEIKESDLL